MFRLAADYGRLAERAAEVAALASPPASPAPPSVDPTAGRAGKVNRRHGSAPRRSQNDDDLPTAMAFRIGLSRYQADFPRAWPGLCHQRKPGDGGRSAMPPAASRHFSSRLAERSSRGRGLFHEPVPQSLLVQLRSLRPDRRQVALRASLRITSLNLSPARRWDFSLSSIQRSSQIRLAPCSSTGFS